MSKCVRCQGEGEPSAELRSFSFAGRDLNYLAMVASCGVCGFRWEDDAYTAKNTYQREEARRAADADPETSIEKRATSRQHDEQAPAWR